MSISRSSAGARRRAIASLALCLALLGACAARVSLGPATPSRPGDGQLTCEAIGDEMGLNSRRAARIEAAVLDLSRRSSGSLGGSHGSFVAPDDRRQAQDDVRALEARNARLADLGDEKRCTRQPGR